LAVIEDYLQEVTNLRKEPVRVGPPITHISGPNQGLRGRSTTSVDRIFVNRGISLYMFSDLYTKELK
jgi:hypothetical protein